MNSLLVMFLFKASIHFVDFPAMFDDQKVIVIILIEIVLLQYS